MRRGVNALREEANNLRKEINFLNLDINELQSEIGYMEKSNAKLKSITHVQDKNVDSLVELVHENQKILNEMRVRCVNFLLCIIKPTHLFLMISISLCSYPFL
jgi:peptidoglycan hydrolase CwlO-like protein